MSENKIRVTYYNQTQEGKNQFILATVGLHIKSMDMYLAKCKLLRKKDGGCYIAPPSEKYTDPKTGSDKWANFFWFGDKTSEFFQKEALNAITEHCQSKGINPPTFFEQSLNQGHSEPVPPPNDYMPSQIPDYPSHLSEEQVPF